VHVWTGILMLSALLIFTRKRALICIRECLVLQRNGTKAQKWGVFVGNQPPFSVAPGLVFLMKLDAEVLLMLTVRDNQFE
jgi:hypothetical protein